MAPVAVLIARLADRADVVEAVETALVGGVTLLPLGKGPSGMHPHALQLHAPDLGRPVVLQAVLTGEALGGMFPLQLGLVSPRDEPKLRAFVASGGAWPEGEEEEARKSVPPPAAAPAEAPAPAPAAVRETEAGAGTGGAAASTAEPEPVPPPRPPSGRPSSAAPGKPEDPYLGRVLGSGRYEILARLGEGGMGKVYRARHVALDKVIALKILHATLRTDPDFAGRFHREALSASRLDHPNVTQVLDFGEEPDGTLFIAMEYLDGPDLATVLEKDRNIGLERSVAIMSQVCAALAAAHDQGIIHRDIKPENVVLVPHRADDGSMAERVKVCDFGIAKMQGEEPAQARRGRSATAPGLLQGTPAYMSPEQVRGEKLDARSDVYACGVMLYELAAGRQPFVAENAIGVLTKHLAEKPALPSRFRPDTDPALEAVVLRALEKDKELRHADARELRDDLLALVRVRADVPSPRPGEAQFGSPGLESGGAVIDERSAAVVISDVDEAAAGRKGPPSVAPTGVRLPLAAGRAASSAPPEADAALPAAQPAQDEGEAPVRAIALSMEDERPAAVVVQADDEGLGSLDVEGDAARLAEEAPLAAVAAPAPIAVPIEDHASGFVEFVTALTATIAHTTYYQRGHPEFAQSLMRLLQTVQPPLTSRREISLARRDVEQAVQLDVQTGTGESVPLKKALPASLYENCSGRLGDVFQRRRLISLTLKEGIPSEEMADVVELIAGPEIDVRLLRKQFLARGLRWVSILFAEDMLGRGRKLPWQVDLCISRLARDLRVLPLLRGMDMDGMLRLRSQLVGDVVRPLKAEQVRLLLANSDLITDALQRVPELSGLDIAPLVVAALPQALCLGVAGLTLSDLEEEAVSGLAGIKGTDPRRLMEIIGARFIRERTIESDAVLRELHARAILAFPQLPADLQMWILAEQFAEKVAENADQMLRPLDALYDVARYARELRTLERAMRVLARRGRVGALWACAATLERHARGAEPGEASREALAAKALQTLGDAEILRLVSDAFLGGAHEQREHARAVLASLPAAAAGPLCEARLAAEPQRGGYPHFVAALREMGEHARGAITGALAHVAEGEEEADAALAQDLLRAVPEIADKDLGLQVARFVGSPTRGVRRAAIHALAAVWDARGRAQLTEALSDPDEGVRLAALSGLRRAKSLGAEHVECLARLLDPSTALGEELRATAAASLGEIEPAGRPAAAQALMAALKPRPRSLMDRLRAQGEGQQSDLVLETMCRALLRVGGDDGRKAVAERAKQSKPETRRKLLGLLEG
ncbi:MAG: protein kinase [Deltaproteobacteria bacterium]|nr:protein kinase [Deltaproteobacteria bacterium]